MNDDMLKKLQKLYDALYNVVQGFAPNEWTTSSDVESLALLLRSYASDAEELAEELNEVAS